MSKECPKQEGRRNEKFKEDYPKWIFEQVRPEEEVKAKKMRILISLTQATQKSSILITRKEL